MVNINNNQQVDEVLRALNHYHKEYVKGTEYNEDGHIVGHKFSKYADRLDIFQFIIFSKRAFVDKEDLLLILEYLEEEKMIDCRVKNGKDYNEYSIKFRGRFLIENGGYVQTYKDSESSELRNWLVSFWVAVGSVGILIVEILRDILPCFLIWHSNCCS